MTVFAPLPRAEVGSRMRLRPLSNCREVQEANRDYSSFILNWHRAESSFISSTAKVSAWSSSSTRMLMTCYKSESTHDTWSIRSASMSKVRLFRYGSLKEAAAAAAFVEISWLDALLADSAAWQVSAAQRWKEWVQLCLLCAMRNIPCACTFGRPSPINQPPDAVTDPREFSRHFAIAEGVLRSLDH